MSILNEIRLESRRDRPRLSNLELLAGMMRGLDRYVPEPAAALFA